MNHLVLLGDSIFDNAADVEGAPAVIDQVRNHLPDNWQATLLAVDGNVSGNVKTQLKRLPADVTHLALSVGGNDALGVSSRFYAPAAVTMMQALGMLSRLQLQFQLNYERAVDHAASMGLPLLVCTIYDQVPDLPAELRSALSLFNDVIVRVAVRRGLPVLDLRAICTEASDYAAISPIEPSSSGGDKVAMRLVQAVLSHDYSLGKCRVFGV